MQKERILMVGLVGESAAARFLPRKLLIENNSLDAGRSEFLGGKRAGWTAAKDGNLH